MMDKDDKEKLEMEEHVPVTKRVYKTREDLEVFGFTHGLHSVRSIASGGGEHDPSGDCSNKDVGRRERKTRPNDL